jgi:hypothetical protein
MADCRGKVLKVAPGAAIRAALFGIFPACRAGDFAQAPLAEEFKQPPATFGRFLRARLVRRGVSKVHADNVGNGNRGYVAFAARRGVFGGDIGGERRFSLSTLAIAEASAMLASAVLDDPDGSLVASVSLAGGTEP